MALLMGETIILHTCILFVLGANSFLLLGPFHSVTLLCGVLLPACLFDVFLYFLSISMDLFVNQK